MGSFGFAKRRKPFLDKGSFIGVAISTNHWVLHDLLRDWANRILRNGFFADTCCRYNVFNQGVLTDTTNMYGIYIAHICLYIYTHNLQMIYRTWSSPVACIYKELYLGDATFGAPSARNTLQRYRDPGFPSWLMASNSKKARMRNTQRNQNEGNGKSNNMILNLESLVVCCVSFWTSPSFLVLISFSSSKLSGAPGCQYHCSLGTSSKLIFLLLCLVKDGHQHVLESSNSEYIPPK